MKSKYGPKKGSTYKGNHPYKFGKILAEERRKKGYSQPEFANLLGTTKRVISRYEREVKNPNYETIKKIAEALEISTTYFFKKIEEDNPIDVQIIDRGLSKRFEIAQKLPYNARIEIKKLIDTLAKANNIGTTNKIMK